ncbi:o-succinylbenzoate synthase [Vespertiliibacter pulmonis]|uniref:o-succinylbenzoate synthase n=1 Tax=Vespertiliibacter pulmonis TaxID=1443036 RepID=A0A3N4VY46_9PAST|nr:o-succinylbenzoate synthase [Vespertiliibacter pulmonis]QLB20282.1 o-succinylbenzoate synthase [Vespertiliibacter pulmonis]RPE86263.1 O-succinylbenzoate synthase [Vespertiliibacter pulmonis]
MRKARLYHYQIPLKVNVVLRYRPMTQRQGLLVCLEEKGNMGWGEIAPLPHFSQEDLDIAELTLRHWINQWEKALNPSIENLPPSVAFGLSCALAELSGTLAMQGNYQTVPLCKGNLSEFAEQLHEQKTSIAKLKIGFDPEHDGKMVEDFLHAFPYLMLRLDANRIWQLPQAELFAKQISLKNRKRIQFIEEPCQTPELSQQFAIQQQIAIAWDESVRESSFTIKKMPYLTAIVLKPMLIGSIQKCIKLIEQAHQQGMLAVISSSIESSLGLSQLARIAYQYTPNTIPGLDTLNLMPVQLIRPWQGSSLPIVNITSPFITPLKA